MTRSGLKFSWRLVGWSLILLLWAAPLSAQGGGQSGGGSGGGNPDGATGPATPAPTAEPARPTGSASGGRASGTAANSETEAAGQSISPAQQRELASLARWLRSASVAAWLGVHGDGLLEQATVAAAAGVPAELFQNRLREAVAKQAQPGQIADSLAVDAANWRFIAGVVAGDRWLTARQRVAFFLAIGTALRNGFAQASLEEAVCWARTARIGADRLAAATAATAGRQAVVAVQPAPTLRLLKALAASRLPTSQFNEALGLLQAAVGSGVNPEVAIMALEGSLAASGNLTALRAALSP
ncbi:MAG: hypothetical protein A2087_10090 [Spirochaetes bacterium GWD1_61_31]|nr:MAG: hypothetical protein A2Y37_01910 [Spirochaetes bacterium GWB1_60_80]OHD32030.1 MAG: hypothetical protein A2004_06305 [Spirochaetes bacterium GWC1_61_12]OHD40628.1 MAG: hypothetical protein A2087_10090 [Spirochaetes bacterium GWD1_61_31]OHD43900.1 MAG: hypothetical protein A2Y35_12440 [Spirochaetes bacterium GWE1_60_18]OHD59771.1 MAG: hypothetical protein A2Y32_02295 [Spirochaetes bacterium GWF1_60_12]HAP43502.1 hypothetical protein [Spirochaetaceae bacterium]